MKFKKILTNHFSAHRNDEMTTIAIVSGLAVGIAVGALFATTKGRELRKKVMESADHMICKLTGNTRKKANAKLGNLITDVRNRIKQNAEGLQGPATTLNPLNG